MSLLKRIITLSLLSLLVTGFMTSCDKCIYDDLSECPQGVIFKFHTQTPCEAVPSYPSTIRETRVFAFDEEGVLMNVFDQKEVTLSSEYQQKFDYLHVGTTTFVAWAGEDLSRYDFSTFEAGKTTKQEMMVALKRQAEQATADMPHLYVGTPIDGTLTQEDYRDLGSHFDIVNFRMQQLTNTVRLTVRGLDPEHQYSVEIVAANSRYSIMGDVLQDSRVTYTSPNGKQAEDGTLTYDFRLLKLEHHKDIKLIVTDLTLGKEVHSRDLVDDLINYYLEANNMKLECMHEFDLELELTPLTIDTYMAVQATINQWNIVFRDVAL